MKGFWEQVISIAESGKKQFVVPSTHGLPTCAFSWPLVVNKDHRLAACVITGNLKFVGH